MQIMPISCPSQPVVDFSYGVSYFTTATGNDIPLVTWEPRHLGI